MQILCHSYVEPLHFFLYSKSLIGIQFCKICFVGSPISNSVSGFKFSAMLRSTFMRSLPAFLVTNSFFRNLFITRVRVSFSSVYKTCTKGPHDCSNFRNIVKIGAALKRGMIFVHVLFSCCICRQIFWYLTFFCKNFPVLFSLASFGTKSRKHFCSTGHFF